MRVDPTLTRRQQGAGAIVFPVDYRLFSAKDSIVMSIALLLILAATAYRVLMGFGFGASSDWLQNFAPMAAIAICGGVYLPKRIAFAAPLVAMFVSDLILNVFRYNVAPFSISQLLSYAALAAIVALGFAMRKRSPRPAFLLGGTLLGSLAFFLVTNTTAWLSNPVYTKTFAGWLQACTVGDPAVSPPTWVFFRNSLVSDLLYTTLFFACMSLTQQRKPEPNLSRDDLSPGSAGLLPR